MNHLPSLIPFMESLGLRFSLDWELELAITSPPVIPGHDIIHALEPFSDGIGDYVRMRVERGMQVCMGGPFNGQRHGWFYLGYKEARHFRAVKVRRAHWAVYEVHQDGRAIFQGFASSQKKARQGQLKAAAKEAKSPSERKASHP